jgi:hypothetical protein
VSDVWTAVVSAAVGSLGTIAVAALGYRQWRQQQSAAAAQEFDKERAAALRELWSLLSDQNATSRRVDALRAQEFYAAVRDLNTFLIRTAPYLTTEEQDLARLYLETLFDIRAAVEERRSAAAREELVTTGRLRDVGRLAGALALGEAAQRIETRLVGHLGDALAGRGTELTRAEVEALRGPIPREPSK